MSLLMAWERRLRSELRVDTSDKIRLYDQALASFALSTKHLLLILHPDDDNSDSMKYLNVALNDPCEDIWQFISKKVAYPISYLTYN